MESKPLSVLSVLLSTEVNFSISVKLGVNEVWLELSTQYTRQDTCPKLAMCLYCGSLFFSSALEH